MKSHATHFIHQDHFLVLNKCLEQEMAQWNPIDPKLQSLKSSLDVREKELKKTLRENFPFVLEFSEIMSRDPSVHVNNLTKKWNSYAK